MITVSGTIACILENQGSIHLGLAVFFMELDALVQYRTKRALFVPGNASIRSLILCNVCFMLMQLLTERSGMLLINLEKHAELRLGLINTIYGE